MDTKDKPTYVELFNGLQDLTREITGKPLGFKALCASGNLLAIGTDMELALIQGADAEEIMKHISHICLTHCKRGVHDLRHEVSEEEFQWLMNFPYLESEEAIDEFTVWVKSLKRCKVEDWWQHKLQPFILSGIVQCCSKMDPTAWATTRSTTNLNESQHHWTNIHTGTRKSITEAIVTARKLDVTVADEIYDSLRLGIQRNNNSSSFHWTIQNSNRASTTRQKQKASCEHQEKLSGLRDELRTAEDQAKNLKAKIQEVSGKPAQSCRVGAALSNSSGRVTTTGTVNCARESAAPYPQPKLAHDNGMYVVVTLPAPLCM
ncbi:hypothetical protein GYMLUDRAFT_71340 [Collybiopsis luxurians FD-317 M1]|nr:hypothetical protein GYMLUDRAFT_71340 [Collybiopsis luxurians FD-317 M1]